jgi:elongation factor Ts
LTEKIAKIGENLNIRRFARFEKGEGLEKRNDDFANEVANMIK